MKECVRLNSEKKIDNFNFKLKIGTTNKLRPQAIYVEGSTFIEPLLEKEDYNEDVNDIRHNFKCTLSNNLKKNDIFDTKFILDFSVPSNRMVKNKKSFLSFQFLVKQPNEHILKLNDVKEKSGDFINNIISSLYDDILEHNFSVHKSKK